MADGHSPMQYHCSGLQLRPAAPHPERCETPDLASGQVGLEAVLRHGVTWLQLSSAALAEAPENLQGPSSAAVACSCLKEGAARLQLRGEEVWGLARQAAGRRIHPRHVLQIEPTAPDPVTLGC